MPIRSKLEIYLDLMRAVSVDGNPLHAAEMVSLSLSDTEKHLGFLTSQGFIRITSANDCGAKHELTRKGYEVLEALQGLIERKPAIGTKIIV